ncbi:CPBP family intramembrane metalloprotease [Candidatus Saccharibacteria bacterium]|nr:CPBP family intramembrane metalloprotease [Candidatus Saccharibacteria bacterium]
MSERRGGLIASKLDRMRKRAKKDEKYKKRLTIFWALAITVWVGVAFFAAQIIVFTIAGLCIKWAGWVVNENMAQTICMVISYALALLILAAVAKKFFGVRISRDGLGLRGLPTWTDILLSPVGYIVSLLGAVAVMFVMQLFLPAIDWTQAQDVGFNNVVSSADRMVTFVALVILAPLMEELIFRGYLYGRLRGKMSALPAIILVSVLFGIMHGQWNVGIVVGVMSVILCIAREMTGTIYAGILMHMIRNGVAFYMLYINPMGLAGFGVVMPALLPFLV